MLLGVLRGDKKTRPPPYNSCTRSQYYCIHINKRNGGVAGRAHGQSGEDTRGQKRLRARRRCSLLSRVTHFSYLDVFCTLPSFLRSQNSILDSKTSTRRHYKDIFKGKYSRIHFKGHLYDTMRSVFTSPGWLHCSARTKGVQARGVLPPPPPQLHTHRP